MEKKWYVFDEADCFEHCATAQEAGEKAAALAMGGFEGVHIAHLTKDQFNEYLTYGDLGKAMKV